MYNAQRVPLFVLITASHSHFINDRTAQLHSHPDGWRPDIIRGPQAQDDEVSTSVLLTMLSRLLLTTELVGDAVARTEAWLEFVFHLKSICINRN